MLLKKGIVRKTFFFSSAMMILVIVSAFAILYFAMPRFYLKWKQTALQNNVAALTQKLKSANDYETAAAYVVSFTEANNVSLMAFDRDENLVAEISTPFIGIREIGDTFFVTGKAAETGDGAAVYDVKIGVSPADENIAAFTKDGFARKDAVIYSDTADIAVYRAQPPDENYQRRKPPEDGMMLRWALSNGPANSIALDSVVGTDLVDIIRVRGALQPIDEASGVVLALLPYVLGLAIVLVLILSGFYANRVSKPLLTISDAALKMQTMAPDAISGIRTDDEIGRLSSNLDALYQKLLENIGDLRNEMDEVSRLERSKSEMMQSASHELKTPIAALSGMLEGMLDNVGLYKNKEKYLLECKLQVDRLAALVAEILDASKQDMPERETARENVDVCDIIRRAIGEYKADIEAKRIAVNMRAYISGENGGIPERPSENNRDLSAENSPGSEDGLLSVSSDDHPQGAPYITTDTQLFYRVVSNLLSNAARYTPEGGEISIALSRAPGGKLELAFRNDCAEPISDEELAKLPEPFYTRTYSRDREKSGTGLGLYIVRRTLERLGMSYRLENDGSCFSFVIII